ncbi:MAG: ribosome-associated translation inhibitor RaiA [bacterium]
MQIIITGKDIDLTDAIKDYVDKKIGGLEKFYDQIIRAKVNVGIETTRHNNGKFFVAECRLEVPGNDLYASKNEKNLYKAIDKVKDYLDGELKRHKIKSRGRQKKERSSIRETKAYVNQPED